VTTKAYCRCATCQRSNDPQLSLSYDDYTPGPFYDDPHGKYEWDKICAECLNDVNEQLDGFEEEEIDLSE
jgi:hypothetical protein